MRLAHLTDLHLPIARGPTFKQLLNKRALGWLSWRRNRRFRHRIEALERLVADLNRVDPDFTVISGDLVNISLPAEFTAAAQWLGDNFAPERTAIVPGNHDAYVMLPWAAGAGAFDAFMRGERFDALEPRAPADETDFPFVRICGRVAMVFANSSPPTAPGFASGRLGAAQIARIGRELARLGAAGLCRVLVLHHPVTRDAAPARKALSDQTALRDALHAAGVELVLHGHNHAPLWASVETKDGARPVVGGGSASHPDARRKYRPARYNLYTIGGDAVAGWRIDAEARELDPAAGAVETVERRILSPVST